MACNHDVKYKEGYNCIICERDKYKAIVDKQNFRTNLIGSTIKAPTHLVESGYITILEHVNRGTTFSAYQVVEKGGNVKQRFYVSDEEMESFLNEQQ